MSEKAHSSSGQARRLTLKILQDLFGGAPAIGAGFRLWDGSVWPEDPVSRTTIILKHPGSLRAMLLAGSEVGLAEAFLYGEVDIEGDVESVFALADFLGEKTGGWRTKLLAAKDLLRLPAGKDHPVGARGPARLSGKRHSVERDRQAISYHYDVSNEFYALWLDRHMVYSCAYFHSPEETLDEAQERKLNLVCRKLRLNPGQRLLDLGCGWGGLAIYAAKRYGVDATGITLSEPQAELANERIAAAGLSDRCRVEVRDYREVEDDRGYDAIASIGMFEHVGEKLLATYFDQALRLLNPGGVFLNHGIASRATDEPTRGPSFSDVYVFPDGELVPIHVTLRAAEEVGFEVRDVESLREHYALTLRRWVRRLESRREKALQCVDEPTYRVWRLFMAGSAYGFTRGRLNVYQSLLIKTGENGRSGLPLTRRDWYTPEES